MSKLFFNKKIQHIDIQDLRNKVGEYYFSLSPHEKILFLNRLAPNMAGCMDIRYWEDFAKETLAIVLSDFLSQKGNKKYETVNKDVLAVIVRNNMMEKNMSIYCLLRLFDFDRTEQNPIFAYFGMIKCGKFPSLDISAKDVADIVGYRQKYSEMMKIANNGIKEDNGEYTSNIEIPLLPVDKAFLGILSCSPTESIKHYLAKKPQNPYLCMNALSLDDALAVLEFFKEDPLYQAKLILSSRIDITNLTSLFSPISDKFVKEMIWFAKFDSRRFSSPENSLGKVEAFLNVKKEFFSLSEEKRIEYLASLANMGNNNVDFCFLKEVNDIKWELLSHLTSKAARYKVINSMTNYIDPALIPCVSNAQMMIKEFLTDKCELSEKQKEDLDVILATTDVYFGDTERHRGLARLAEQEIVLEIGEKYAISENDRLMILLHEYSHIISRVLCKVKGKHASIFFEEGMADVFAEQVINHFSKKYQFAINSSLLEKRGRNYIFRASYSLEHSVVKSMLYPLEMIGKDKVAIKEYLFGDKSEFMDLVMGVGFSQTYEGDARTLVGENFNEDVFIAANYKAFCLPVNFDSLYFQGNVKFAEMQRKAFAVAQSKTWQYMPNNSYSNVRKTYKVKKDKHSNGYDER